MVVKRNRVQYVEILDCRAVLSDAAQPKRGRLHFRPSKKIMLVPYARFFKTSLFDYGVLYQLRIIRDDDGVLGFM